MAQNKSHAVMAQRHESSASLDDFPTPPWATRGFLKYILGGPDALGHLTCLEPACNRGFMVRPLWEFFYTVSASDIRDYGCGYRVNDLLAGNVPADSVDWVITNPPFKCAEQFAIEGLRVARVGVALLVRTVFIEGVGRHNRLFKRHPPHTFAQYSERVPMVKGRVDPNVSTATGYGWIVWRKDVLPNGTSLKWIPPCRKKLEKSWDYSF